MSFLLDTSVLSLFAPGRPPVPMELQNWLVRQGERQTHFVSSITVVEIQRGIAKLRRFGSTRRAVDLAGWLHNLLAEFDQRLLSVDAQAALIAGEKEDEMIGKARSPGLADILIAATAKAHGMAVATTNTRHFAPLGVPHFDPFVELPQ